MENNQDGQEVQKTPEEVIAELQARISDLEPKANASSQNFERLKKIEQEKKELEDKLNNGGETKGFDSVSLERKIEEKVSLRMAGHSPEEIEEMERYAKGAGVSLSEAAKSPFVQKAIQGIRAEKRSTESTPPPSSKIKVFNGQPVNKVLSEGSPAEKQAAWESLMKGGANTNE